MIIRQEKILKNFYKRLVIFSVFLIMLQLIFNCKNGKKILATFNGGNVSQDEYIELYLASTEHKPDKLPDESNLKKLVTRIAIKKIKILEAKAENLQNDSTYIKGFKKRKFSLLYTPYVDKEIVGLVISDSLIQMYYKHFSPQYKLLYIQCPYTQINKKAQRDTIENIYRMLQTGIPFEKVAEGIKNRNKKNIRNGDYGWVIPESIGNKALKMAMERIKLKSYSEPVDTQHEYQIIYKSDIRDVPVPPYDEVRDKIRNHLIRIHKKELEKAVNNRLKELKQKYHYKVDYVFMKKIEQKVIEHVSEKYLRFNFKKLSSDEMGKFIATFDGGGITVNELFERRHKRPDNMHEFRERIDVMARLYLFGKDAVELGLDKLPEINSELSKLSDNYLAYILTSNNVEQKIALKIDSLKQNQGVDEKELMQKKALLRRDLKIDFERKLRQKYNYKYIKDNFDTALKEALRQKRIQVDKKSIMTK
jgi:peptidyl-prolyl cis-trans isomerase C